MLVVPLRVELANDELHFGLLPQPAGGVYSDFRSQATALGYDFVAAGDTVVMQLSSGLDLVRELSPRQRGWDFRFTFADDASREYVQSFIGAVRAAREGARTLIIGRDDIERSLRELGFTRRALTQHQLRDLAQLLALPNGANFSVPGAGKTTVSMALNALTMGEDSQLIVVSPKSAFQAWEEVVEACFDSFASDRLLEPFTRLTGDRSEIHEALLGVGRRFVINYEMATPMGPQLRQAMARRPTHLVIDESHRIKAGERSQRGSTVLGLAALASRRDILSGTPMPQGANDIASQADFLWPGVGIGRSIRSGASPSSALKGLFVRTTKDELGLPPVSRRFEHVPMNQAQLVLYSILRERTIAQATRAAADNPRFMLQARASSIRLLQASVNPALTAPVFSSTPELITAAIEEGATPKVLRAIQIARDNARRGKKTLIWTIFTSTLLQLVNLMPDMEPAMVFGGNVEGQETDRDGSIRRFLTSDSCMVMVANPAAASEGLSLHTACHDAIYVDRTYNAAHFLQSIDRIHRLGLPPETETTITILQSETPDGIGNIDLSVSRRLQAKTRDLGRLLADPELHEIAMAEDDAPPPVDWDMNRDDVLDLLYELEVGRGRLPSLG